MRATIVAVGVAIVSALLAAPAVAGERVELFKPNGEREGYAIVDEKSGRVDFYDRGSRHTGYGKVDDTGRVERFDLKGRRHDPSAVPLRVLPKR